MAQRTQIVAELKRMLKEHHITYAVVATKLELSLASVKRLFSTGDFSLQRLDAICELAGVEMSDLVERMSERTAPVNQLTVAQEQEVVSDPKLFLVTWLVFNRTKFEDIVKGYTLSEREVQKYLIKLDRLHIIELQPLNRVRLLVSRHFSWRAGGPVQRYLHQKLLKEFLSTNFSDDCDEFFFHGGAVSEHVLSQLKRALQHAARECIEIIEADQSPPASRNGAAFVLALRPWQYSGFAEFSRE
jgi:DNA-binding Xre family transcriptional regulator